MLAAQARATAEAWEKRARQLQQKYGKVDLEEHQKLQAELAAARERAEALQATLTAKEAELAQVHAQYTLICLTAVVHLPHWLKTSRCCTACFPGAQSVRHESSRLASTWRAQACHRHKAHSLCFFG